VITSATLQLRRAFFPLTERTFTYARYEALLDDLADAKRFRVVPLCELSRAVDAERAVVSLRHDADERLDRAADFARLEHERGLRATYYVLQTARYWQTPELVPTLLCMQDVLGHEIGWHNDLVTLECVLGADARATLAAELERLRGAGLRIVGTSSHGSPACYRYGFHNGYFFFPAPVPGFPNADVVNGPLGPKHVPRGTLEEFGFDYEAYHLEHDLYVSDAAFDASGARWHTDQLDLSRCTPGSRTIILTHPDHWDASAARKLARFAWKVADKVRR
jgi:hypothetical protein